MDYSREYLVPADAGEAEFVEKRSRFIGRVWPVASAEEAMAHIAGTREKHWDASHNVHAFIVRDGPTRYGDDGEPQGTAGMPTLNVFRNGGVFNVCCVVTRYYGGILLGAGGLVRAYSAAAKMALDDAGLAMMRRWSVLLIPCPYALFESMKNLVAAEGGVIESAEYGVDVLIEALLPHDGTEAFIKKTLDLSSGQVTPEVMDSVFRGARL